MATMLLYTNLIFAAVVLHQLTVANSSSSSQDDCIGIQCVLEDQYCAGKSCLNHSTCLKDADCLNRSNMWMQPMCIGSVKCEMSSDVEGKPGYCSKICDRMCNADKDCGEQQYCGANVCRDHNTCQKDMDCRNPSNPWGKPKCIGFDKCQDGFCHRTCGYHCEDKSERVECLESPCTVNKYDDGFSCVNDYCGGCNAIVFDAAGNEEFVPILPKDTSDHRQPLKFSEECIELCPEVIGDWHTSKCDSKKLGDCACPYEPDKFCQLECHDDSPNWSLKCTRGLPLTDDDSKELPSSTDSGGEPSAHYAPFETPPECVQTCSEADLKYNAQCDFKTMDGCRCVSTDNPYCFYTCFENGLLAMACQNIPNILPPPPDDNRDDMTPYPSRETTTPVPTPAVRVGKKQKKINKENSRSEKAGKAKKEAKQTK